MTYQAFVKWVIASNTRMTPSLKGEAPTTFHLMFPVCQAHLAGPCLMFFHIDKGGIDYKSCMILK